MTLEMMNGAGPAFNAGGAQPALSIQGLSVDLRTDSGPVTVLSDVNLAVGRGQTVGLVGESGSGKTMTGLAAMGLLPRVGRITEGRIELSGEDLVTASVARLRRLRGCEIAMIFQEPRRSLDPCFTVGDQIAETVRAHEQVSRKEARRRAVAMLDLVQIPDAGRRMDNYPHEFSGGQCQRVMLAIALACQPSVLIADEPTTGLDVTVQRAMLRLIADLQREMELAVLFVTHDLGVVAEICDDVVVMYAGQVVEQASTVDLFDRPRHPYSMGLLSSVTQLNDGSKRLTAIPGAVPFSAQWPDGCRFHPRCSHSTTDCAEISPPLVGLGPRGTARCSRLQEIEIDAAGLR